MSIQAVIFDMYETLVTQFCSPLYYGTQIAEDLGLRAEEFLPGWRATEEARATGKLTFEDAMAELLHRHGLSGLHRRVVEKRIAIQADCFRHLHPGIEPMLSALRERGIRIGLITNCFSEEATLIRESELFPYFDAPCLSWEEGVRKPDPAIYRTCLRRLGIAPENCLYVGDGGSFELETAGAWEFRPSRPPGTARRPMNTNRPPSAPASPSSRAPWKCWTGSPNNTVRRDTMQIFHNAVVYTGDDFTDAFAVEDGRFVAIGAEALALQGERIDLNGAFVCAGFNDSHMHLLNYGQALQMAPLGLHTGSLAEMLQCLKNAAPDRGWIIGRGWNQDRFSDVRRMPDRHDLDTVSAELPVCAVRACGHALAVNSKAMEVLGITAETPSPDGGGIDFENGRFFDNAMDLVLNAIPAPDKQTLKGYIRTACADLNRRGITSCHSDDYCVFRQIPWQTVNEAYRELESEGALTVRVREQCNLTTVPDLMEFIRTDHPATDRFSMGPLKLLGDGALGARTAFLSRPYADEPGTRGLSVFTGAQFDELIGTAHAHGMQVAVHCIGDACLDLVLDAIEKAQAEHPRPDARHGIVHCQITRPDQLRRIAKGKLHVYAQSIFLDYDIHIVHERAGDELAATSYSWKTLLDTGATVSNGSDCPVEAPDVLAGIQCAVTRQDLHGCAPYLPQEAFTIKEALDSFTQAGAFASFEEHTKGRIAPGYCADFVVLGEDPFRTTPATIKEIPILQTWLEGDRVW